MIMASNGVRWGVAGPPAVAATLWWWAESLFVTSLCNNGSDSVDIIAIQIVLYDSEYDILQIETHLQVGPLFLDFIFRPHRATHHIHGFSDLQALGGFALVGEIEAAAD